MEFKLLPVLSIMEELYAQPISKERFHAYLNELQGGTKGDMALPIAAYNPMAKAHILEKIDEMKFLQAERLIAETLEDINDQLKEKSESKIQVALVIADDLKGGWTNHYTTDFDSKFKLNAFVERNFCTPYFWTSETYSSDLIRARTRAYVYRTIYWLNEGKVKTLEDHFKQEVFVAQQFGKPLEDNRAAFQDIQAFYERHRQTEDYSLIFNFFYGDTAAASLGYPTYGVGTAGGFELARANYRRK